MREYDDPTTHDEEGQPGDMTGETTDTSPRHLAVVPPNTMLPTPLTCGLRGCDICRAQLREAMRAAHDAFQQMFPHYIVARMKYPTAGAPKAFILAWATQATAKAVHLDAIAQEITFDLAYEDAEREPRVVAYLAQAQALSRHLLRECFPEADTHERFLGSWRQTQVAPFTEIVQIQQAAARLAMELSAIVARCTCGI